MPHRVAEDDGGSAVSDRGAVEFLDDFGTGADRVFGHEHDRKFFAHGEVHGALRERDKMIHGPVFGQPADGTGADERGRFHGNPGALGNLRDGADVVLVCARGSVGPDLHAAPGNFLSQAQRVLKRPRTGTGKPDVHRLDAQSLHEVEDFQFVFDRRVFDRGILEAVAKGLVGEGDVESRGNLGTGDRVPVVDVIVEVQ